MPSGVMTPSTPELQAGDLDGRVTLLQPVYNQYGDEIVDWLPYKVWASVDPQFGRESNTSDRTVMAVSVEVCIRYRSDIDARWRIADDQHTYEIVAMVDVQRRGAQLKLSCVEVQ
jgi:SPP1 family predicted phage head-tail adaptor